MIVEYLDLKTGLKAKEKGVGLFSLIEGGWSCDCNRELAFDLNKNSNICLGCKRIIVINVEPETEEEKKLNIVEVIRDANSEYLFNIERCSS